MLKAKTTRISEFELGKRLPNLLLLAAYARLGDIPMEFLVLDGIDVAYFTDNAVLAGITTSSVDLARAVG